METEKQSYYKNNRLKQMRAFCEVVRTGSITLAAQKLFLSQPSVTLQIQAMERELGVTVFERRGPVLKLTPDGEALYALGEAAGGWHRQPGRELRRPARQSWIRAN